MVRVIGAIADEVLTMSTSTPSAPDTPDASTPGLQPSVDLETVLAPLRATSFYAAVALPLAYVPLLVAGLETVPQVTAFAALLALNLLALVVGHGHDPGE